MARHSFIAVVGHGPDLERPEGAAWTLRGLGARVVTLDLWDDPAAIAPRRGETLRAVLVETPERPDRAVSALRSLRRCQALDEVGVMVALSPGQVARLDPAAGFDDFVLAPYVPAELYARIRAVEWRRSEFSNDELIKIGATVIDRSGREVRVGGREVLLTAREFGLLVHLAERRGRVVTRDSALAHVWGENYDGGPRTVDIHIRRLRSKLGDALPIVTLRGTGYKIAAATGREEQSA